MNTRKSQMALEVPNDQTFFDGLLNDTNFRSAENELLNKTTDKGGNKTSRKSKTTAAKAQGKENLTPKRSKPGRPSQKTAKQPLKVLTDRKTPKNNAKLTPSPRKKRQTVPKIIVYKDADAGKRRENKNGRRVSKSLEARHSMPPKSPRLSAPAPQTTRHSFNDLPSLSSLRSKNKLTPGGDVPKPRLPKLKPDDPQFAEMLAKLELLFPGVDPDFLKAHFIKFKTSLSETIDFILFKEKTDDLPTRADYMRRLETEKLHQQFIDSFSIDTFLKIIPDPWHHFLNTHRHNSPTYSAHSFHYLKNKFKKHYIQHIHQALANNDHSLYLAHKHLAKKTPALKIRATNRSKAECDAGKPLTFNAHFAHEVAFIENESKIKAHLRKAKADKEKRFQRAQKEGSLLECQSCNDLTLLPEDAVACVGHHVFCKGCVVKHVETEVDKNNFRFKCLIKCEEQFSLEALKAVLSPVLMANIIKRNQAEEVKSAGIEDLVYCPFCYYVIVTPPEHTVLKCLNPCCMTESCRLCKQPNHAPLTCHELDKFDKTISDENAPPTPLRCTSCSAEFVKSEGSSRVECPCGARMCSVCRQPFAECRHSKEGDKEPSPGLSSSAETEESTAGSVDSSTENLVFLPSGSDIF